MIVFRRHFCIRGPSSKPTRGLLLRRILHELLAAATAASVTGHCPRRRGRRLCRVVLVGVTVVAVVPGAVEAQAVVVVAVVMALVVVLC